MYSLLSGANCSSQGYSSLTDEKTEAAKNCSNAQSHPEGTGKLVFKSNFDLSLSYIGEGNGNPLQCSCLENPRDGEPGGLPSLGLHRVGHD